MQQMLTFLAKKGILNQGRCESVDMKVLRILPTALRLLERAAPASFLQSTSVKIKPCRWVFLFFSWENWPAEERFAAFYPETNRKTKKQKVPTTF